MIKSRIQAGWTICKQWLWLKRVSAPRLNRPGLTHRSYLVSVDNGPRLLAIGIDAAEGSFVRRLIEEGELPALSSLLGDHRSRWLSVRSPAHIGSGAVWPTFMTGDEASSHGIYSEWSWCPDT